MREDYCSACRCYKCGQNTAAISRGANGDLVIACSQCGDTHRWSVQTVDGAPKQMLLPVGEPTAVPAAHKKGRRRAQ